MYTDRSQRICGARHLLTLSCNDSWSSQTCFHRWHPCGSSFYYHIHLHPCSLLCGDFYLSDQLYTHTHKTHGYLYILRAKHMRPFLFCIHLRLGITKKKETTVVNKRASWGGWGGFSGIYLPLDGIFTSTHHRQSLDIGFHALESGFQLLELGFRIPIVSWIPVFRFSDFIVFSLFTYWLHWNFHL